MTGQSFAFFLLVTAVPLPRSAMAAATERDRFGVTKLFPTKPGGREWFAQWEDAREVPPHRIDPRDPLSRNAADVPLAIGGGTARIPAGTTLLYVLTPTNQAGAFTVPPWQNVELTVYAKRGASSQTTEWQALALSARSGWHHNDAHPCEGTSYHATARFDGQCGFKKEIWHTGGYTRLAPARPPRPWPTVPRDRWIGMKFVCRNAGGGKRVNLRLYLDTEANNTWRQIVEHTDAGGWRGGRTGCDRPPDYIITEPRPVVYFRTDYVNVEVKWFSVREIAPLP